MLTNHTPEANTAGAYHLPLEKSTLNPSSTTHIIINPVIQLHALRAKVILFSDIHKKKSSKPRFELLFLAYGL
jgi:hypothetical protein